MEQIHTFLSWIQNYELGIYEQIILGLLFIIFAFLFYMGAFKTIIIKETYFGPQNFLYKDAQDDYNNIGKYFQELKDIEKFFSISHCAGIYHDDPCQVKNAKEARFSYGFMVNPGEDKKIQQFQQKYPGFKVKKIQFQGLETYFPLRNMLSFMIGVVKVYSQFKSYFKKYDLKDIGSSVEIYDMVNNKIRFLFPIGDVDMHATTISIFPNPEYKVESK